MFIVIFCCYNVTHIKKTKFKKNQIKSVTGERAYSGIFYLIPKSSNSSMF